MKCSRQQWECVSKEIVIVFLIVVVGKAKKRAMLNFYNSIIIFNTKL